MLTCRLSPVILGCLLLLLVSFIENSWQADAGCGDLSLKRPYPGRPCPSWHDLIINLTRKFHKNKLPLKWSNGFASRAREVAEYCSKQKYWECSHKIYNHSGASKYYTSTQILEVYETYGQFFHETNWEEAIRHLNNKQKLDTTNSNWKLRTIGCGSYTKRENIRSERYDKYYVCIYDSAV